ncbi:MAG: 3-hydroxyacyl-CoA dehydrogenase [Gammaproteobacteria bacterium]|nr:MAG: 3-hydroxyacyl-CoA dehydrogenase [Gammaproteobacteria bacterium]
MKIEGQAALVTGGGSGLGAATARTLAEQGARVAVLDFDGDKAGMVADELNGLVLQADVADADAVASAFDHVVEHFGQAPRVVVNCAGIALAARIVGKEGKTSIDLFDKVLRVNLFGTYHVMTHAARLMMTMDALEDGERGIIINTSSAAAQDGQFGQAAYAASKGGVAAMSLPAAREFAQTGIRVMAIAPGLFNTPMMEALPEETKAGIIANIPFPKRLGHPEEFALMVTQIVANPYLNGELIRLDGATRLPPR